MTKLSAARSDADLRACLQPVAARHRANVAQLAAAYFPDLASAPLRFEAVLTLVTNAMHGMIAARLVHGAEPALEREQLRVLGAAVSVLLAAGKGA